MQVLRTLLQTSQFVDPNEYVRFTIDTRSSSTSPTGNAASTPQYKTITDLGNIIDWGDGTSSYGVEGTGTAAVLTKTYSQHGVYTITIRPLLGQVSDWMKVSPWYNISSIDLGKIIGFDFAFTPAMCFSSSSTGLIVHPIPVVGYGCDVSNLIKFAGNFTSSSYFNGIPPLITTFRVISKGDITVNMARGESPPNISFAGCAGVTSANIIFHDETWTGKTLCPQIFNGCPNLTTVNMVLPKHLIYTTSVSSQSGLLADGFSSSPKLTTASFTPIESISSLTGDSRVYNILRNTFSNCTSLIECNIKLPDTLGVTIGSENYISSPNIVRQYNSMYETFRNCTSLTSVPNLFIPTAPLSAAQSTNTLFGRMFMGCTNLTSLHEDFTLSSVTNTGTILTSIGREMFSGCTSLVLPNGFSPVIETTPSTSSQRSNYQDTFRGMTAPQTKTAQSFIDAVNAQDANAAAVTTDRNTFANATGFSDYDTIPTLWK